MGTRYVYKLPQPWLSHQELAALPGLGSTMDGLRPLLKASPGTLGMLQLRCKGLGQFWMCNGSISEDTQGRVHRRPGKLGTSIIAWWELLVVSTCLPFVPLSPHLQPTSTLCCRTPRADQCVRGAGSAVPNLLSWTSCSLSMLQPLMLSLFRGHFPQHLLSYESTLWGRRML